jgi:hypothetical protein
MDLEILNKGIRIKESIDVYENQLATIRKLYAKKEDLSYDDIEKLFAIASSNNQFVIETLNNDLKKL